MLDDRIKPTLQRANDAFWAVVAEDFPECRYGDFGPMETVAWEIAAETAVRSWLRNNYPGYDD